MKISARTVQILKNFTMINQSIIFKPGKVISTMSPNKEILAKATVAEKFTVPFAIYELNQLLGVMSLFEEPDVQFEGNHLKIINGKENISFFYTDPTMIVSPPEKEVELVNPEINFNLPQSMFQSLTKALHVLQLPSIAVIGDREKITLVAMDADKKTTNNKYEIEVGETQHDFRIVFNGEHMKLLLADYNVSITSGGIANFVGDDIQYWIAANGKQSNFKK